MGDNANSRQAASGQKLPVADSKKTRGDSIGVRELMQRLEFQQFRAANRKRCSFVALHQRDSRK